MRIAKYDGEKPLSIPYDNCEICCEPGHIGTGYTLMAYLPNGSEYVLGKYVSKKEAIDVLQLLDRSFESGAKVALIPATKR